MNFKVLRKWMMDFIDGLSRFDSLILYFFIIIKAIVQKTLGWKVDLAWEITTKLFLYLKSSYANHPFFVIYKIKLQKKR